MAIGDRLVLKDIDGLKALVAGERPDVEAHYSQRRGGDPIVLRKVAWLLLKEAGINVPEPKSREKE